MRVRGTILMCTSEFLNETFVKHKINFDVYHIEKEISVLFGTLFKLPESSLFNQLSKCIIHNFSP